MTDTRARIIAEATRQLTQLGYAAFTIASVRDALGLSSGSMFHAFGSKPALAAAVYVAGMAQYQQTASAAIQKAAPPEAALRGWIAAHLGWIEDHRDLSRYLFSTLPDEVMAEAAAPLEDHNAAFYAALSDLFARAVDAGLMARMERPLAMALCIGPAHEYGRQWIRSNAATLPRQISRTLQDAALAALASTVQKRARSRARKETHP